MVCCYHHMRCRTRRCGLAAVPKRRADRGKNSPGRILSGPDCEPMRPFRLARRPDGCQPPERAEKRRQDNEKKEEGKEERKFRWFYCNRELWPLCERTIKTMSSFGDILDRCAGSAITTAYRRKNAPPPSPAAVTEVGQSTKRRSAFRWAAVIAPCSKRLAQKVFDLAVDRAELVLRPGGDAVPDFRR